MDTLITDLRYAARSLRRTPALGAAAILTLALGISGTTTIFTFANAVVLRPLPFERSHELVNLQAENRFGIMTVPPGGFLDWEASSESFERMAAFFSGSANLTGGGEPEALSAALVTPKFFETLLVTPIVGRTFGAFEGTPQMDQAVLISANLWRRLFQSDPSIIGRPITLDGSPKTVAGVMPAGFDFPRDLLGAPARLVPRVDIWLPFSPRPDDRGNAFLQVIARLRPGVTIGQAAAEMSAVAERLAKETGRGRGSSIRVVDLHTRVVGDVRQLMLTLLAAVGLVLLIGCANVANLLMARATSRRREMAIRSALGASRWRLGRQLLTESVLLATAGGIASLLLTLWSVDVVAAIIPPESLPRLGSVRVDGEVLGFALGVSVLTGLLFGLAPAAHVARTEVSTSLKATAMTQASTPRILDVLVVSEVALACVLLVSAGLLVKSFIRLIQVDPGFAGRETLALTVNLPERTYRDVGEINGFTAGVLDRFRALPGVRDAGVVNWLPFGAGLLRGDFTIEGDPLATQGMNASKLAISPGYFDALGINLVAGRDFVRVDTSTSLRVAIVSASLAERLWRGQNPIGQRLKIGFGPRDKDPWLEIIGVVADVRQQGLARDPDSAIYVPLTQTNMPPVLLRSLWFAVRTDGDRSTTAAALRRELRTVDRLLPMEDVATMNTLVAHSVATPRFRTILFASFALAGLGLVVTGIFGVLANYVTRRSREIGVRIALGAPRGDVLMLVLKRALSLALGGIVIGVPVAALLTRLLAEYLFAVTPLDPATFAAAATALVVLAVAAAYLPARRASMVDPMIALRSE